MAQFRPQDEASAPGWVKPCPGENECLRGQKSNFLDQWEGASHET